MAKDYLKVERRSRPFFRKSLEFEQWQGKNFFCRKINMLWDKSLERLMGEGLSVLGKCGEAGTGHPGDHAVPRQSGPSPCRQGESV